MSSFVCEKCGEWIQDTERGYITGCEHYPIEGPVTTGVLPNEAESVKAPSDTPTSIATAKFKTVIVCPHCAEWTPYEGQSGPVFCGECTEEYEVVPTAHRAPAMDLIQSAWEAYHGPIIDEGGEEYIPLMPPAFRRGFVDGYEVGKEISERELAEANTTLQCVIEARNTLGLRLNKMTAKLAGVEKERDEALAELERYLPSL